MSILIFAQQAEQFAEQTFGHRRAHASAKLQLLAAEHQLEQIRSEVYCRLVQQGMPHNQILYQLNCERPIQAAKLAKDAAEVVAYCAWADYERALAMLRINIASLTALAPAEPYFEPCNEHKEHRSCR